MFKSMFVLLLVLSFSAVCAAEELIQLPEHTSVIRGLQMVGDQFVDVKNPVNLLCSVQDQFGAKMSAENSRSLRGRLYISRNAKPSGSCARSILAAENNNVAQPEVEREAILTTQASVVPSAAAENTVPVHSQVVGINVSEDGKRQQAVSTNLFLGIPYITYAWVLVMIICLTVVFCFWPDFYRVMKEAWGPGIQQESNAGINPNIDVIASRGTHTHGVLIDWKRRAS